VKRKKTHRAGGGRGELDRVNSDPKSGTSALVDRLERSGGRKEFSPFGETVRGAERWLGTRGWTTGQGKTRRQGGGCVACKQTFGGGGLRAMQKHYLGEKNSQGGGGISGTEGGVDDTKIPQGDNRKDTREDAQKKDSKRSKRHSRFSTKSYLGEGMEKPEKKREEIRAEKKGGLET